MVRSRGWLSSLNELAAQNHGLVRTRDAVAAGIDPAWLAKLAKDGRLERKFHGIYVLSSWPIDDLTEFAIASAWAGDDAAVGGEAALEVWRLSDAMPRWFDLVHADQLRLRKRGDGRYRLRKVDSDLWHSTTEQGVRVLTPAAAIQDCIGLGVSSRTIRLAIEQAQRRELISGRDAAYLTVALDRRDRA